MRSIDGDAAHGALLVLVVALFGDHLASLGAQGIDLEPVTDRLPPVLPTDAFADQRQLIIRKLDEFAGLHADHVVSRRLAVDQLIMRLLGIKQGLRDDPTSPVTGAARPSAGGAPASSADCCRDWKSASI